MTNLDFSGGFDLLIAGRPVKTIETIGVSNTMSVNAIDLHGLKPLMDKQEGDEVRAGEALFHDKNDVRIKVISPYNAVVKEIRRAERRLLIEVVLEVKDKKPGKIIEPMNLETIKEEELVQALLKTGLWRMLRQMPFNIIADPEKRPKDIYVSCIDNEPLYPDLNFVLKDRVQDLALGVKLMKKLTRGQVFMASTETDSELPTGLRNIAGAHHIHAVNRYPSGNPQLQCYWVSPLRKNDVAWHINPQDLLAIVDTLRSGTICEDRIITVCGSGIKNRRYVKAPLGSPLKALLGQESTEGMRILAGGVLTGRQLKADGFSGLYQHSVQVLPEGYEREFLRFMRPGTDKPSYSRVFLSSLFGSSEYEMNTLINGEERACVQCGACEEVCPTEILPQFLFKAALANDIEAVQELGILDCSNCGLCTYVCPSKIDLDGIIKTSTMGILKEGLI